MPVLTVSAYNQASDATSLVRSLCNDASGTLYSDAYLLNYVNSAYRAVQRKLANVGMETFTSDYTILTIPAALVSDPALQVQLSFTGISGNVTPASTPALPITLIEPEVITERQTGTTDRFVQMQNMTEHGGLPSLPLEGQLRFWEWRGDSINFIGANISVDIRMRFLAGFPVFSLSAATGLVNTAGTAVTYSSGTQFPLTGWNGQTIIINGVSYVISQVTSATTLTLTGSAGTQTGVSFTGPSSITGSIQILGAVDAISYLAAAAVLIPRGSPLIQQYDQAGMDALDDLVVKVARGQQHSSYRRRAYSSRNGHGPFSW